MTISLLAPDGVPLTAQQERQANAPRHGGGAGRPLGGRSGFRVDTPSNVLTVTANTWKLGPCSAELDPGASVHQGMYGWASDTDITGAINPADQTNARKDILYIQVNDSSAGDNSGAKSAPVLYAAGDPLTGKAPDLTGSRARSFLVGTIDVPKLGGGNPTATLNPARYVAAGGILPVNLSERDALTKYDMLTIQRTDVAGRPLETWDGGEWVRYSRSYAKAAGTAAIGIVGAGSLGGPFGQSFPAGRFSVAPIVTVTTDQTRLIAVAADVTSTGFNLYLQNVTTAPSGNGQIRWTAEQITATSAAG